MRTTCVFVLGAGLLTGCATTPSTSAPDAEREIRLAQGALHAGDTDLALLRLEKARLVYHGAAPEYVTLLMAEAKLKAGEPAQALGLAAEVLEADGVHPGANEVAGKALLRLERYGEAEDRFLAAQRSYSADEAGYRRLADYLRFARGLGAYARADPDVAMQYWQAIEDPQLRYSLDQAVRSAASR